MGKKLHPKRNNSKVDDDIGDTDTGIPFPNDNDNQQFYDSNGNNVTVRSDTSTHTINERQEVTLSSFSTDRTKNTNSKNERDKNDISHKMHNRSKKDDRRKDITNHKDMESIVSDPTVNEHGNKNRGNMQDIS